MTSAVRTPPKPKEQRRPIHAKDPTDNYTALFDTYNESPFAYFGPRDPPKEKPEPAKEERENAEKPPSQRSTRAEPPTVDHWGDRGRTRDSADSRNGARYTALQRDLDQAYHRADALDERVETLDSGWKDVSPRVGEMETHMAARGNRVDDLEIRNKMHAAKIHDLSSELEHVRLENERIKGRLLASGEPISVRHDPAYRYENDRYVDKNDVNHGYADEARRNTPPDSRQYAPPHDAGPPPPRSTQSQQSNSSSVAPRDKYFGFNRYYDPQLITANRREQAPYLAKKHELEESTQYGDDYNYLHERRRRQEEDWRQRQRSQEGRLMKDKPRTYEYTTPYDEYNPPRDINRFFHDSKYINPEVQPVERPDEDYFSQQPAGGLYVLRYHDSGCKSVDVALKSLQTIINSFEGFVLGIAGKDNVFVISGDGDWISAKQPHAPRTNINLTYRSVQNSVAFLWFPNRDKAFDFYSNHFRNPFKEQGFPTQHGFECVYIPMVTPPMLKSFDTYLIIELVDASKMDVQQLQQFEAELHHEMLGVINNSLPMVVSCLKGRDSFKPGTWFKHNSKVLVSRFNYMADVAAIWNSGCIQRMADKYRLDISRMNISAVSLKD